MIRSFATMIEDEFPDIKKLNCTPLIVTKGIQKHSRHATMLEDEFPDIKKLNFKPLIVTKGIQKHSRHRIDRLFRFRKILQVALRRKNAYVVCIVNGMDAFFKNNNNITIINKRSKSYEKFVFRFCDSVTKATESMEISTWRIF